MGNEQGRAVDYFKTMQETAPSEVTYFWRERELTQISKEFGPEAFLGI